MTDRACRAITGVLLDVERLGPSSRGFGSSRRDRRLARKMPASLRRRQPCPNSFARSSSMHASPDCPALLLLAITPDIQRRPLGELEAYDDVPGPKVRSDRPAPVREGCCCRRRRELRAVSKPPSAPIFTTAFCSLLKGFLRTVSSVTGSHRLE